MTDFKNILITGASTGIGKALAQIFASRGRNLILIARRSELLLEIKTELETQYSVRVLIHAIDVRDEAGLMTAVKASEAEIGTIDTVIASAGFRAAGRFNQLTAEDYQRQWDVNVMGVLKTIYATLPSLQRSRGRLCLIGSTNAYLAIPGKSAYCMSKFAIRALAGCLYSEFARFGISVTLINPGWINTGIRQTDNHGVFRSHRRDPAPSWMIMDTRKAAEQIYRAVSKRQREKAITFHSWFGIWVSRFFPSFVAVLMKFLGSRNQDPSSRRLI
jgi:short-subunit dehydrogenase